MDELTRVDAWLQTTLTGDATLATLVDGRVFADIAPQGTPGPFIVHQFQGGADNIGNGGNRVLVNGVWLVRVVAQTDSYLPLQPIADRIDAVLHRGAGGAVLTCTSEQPYRLTESAEGASWRHLGRLFRIQVQV